MTVPDSGVRKLHQPEGALEYDVQGAGPLVVCLPGMGELRSSFRFNIGPLVAGGFRVATMDLRGHGGSDTTFSSYDDIAAGTDVLALIVELGGPAVIVGNSMGAGGAVWAAAEDPALVAGLALLGPFVRNPPMNPLMAWAFRLAMAGPWAPAAWSMYLSSLYPSRKPQDFEQHRAEIRASMRRPGYAQAFRATTRTSHAPAEARLAEVSAPALVVMGEADPDFKDPAAEAAWITERLNAEQLLVSGAGHYPQVERPEIVSPALVDFCAKVLGGA